MSSFLKCMSKELYWKDFHNAKQKWNGQMDTEYDKHVYCRNGKWVIIITMYDTYKKVPWTRHKNFTLAEQLKQITRRLTDSSVQQMKTTCHNGKHLCKGEQKEARLGLPAKGNIKAHSFHLQGPVMTCTRLHEASGMRANVKSSPGKNPPSAHTHWK